MSFAELVDALNKDLARNFPHGLKSVLNILSNPGIISVLLYRYNSFVSGLKPRMLGLILLIPGRLIDKIYGDVYGISISRRARIGGGLKIGHFGGIFVNDMAVLGENVSISTGVVIGVSGRGEKRGAPVIGSHVYIGPGAKIHGAIRVGSNVAIGTNAVVFRDVPDNSVVFAPEPLVRSREERA